LLGFAFVSDPILDPLNGAKDELELRERVRPHPDVRGSFVVGGLRLAYEIHGDAGPTVVFLPGVGFPRVYFRPLAGLLKSRMRCVLLDTRGAGDSEGPGDKAAYELEGQAGDVVALLDHLGVQRAWIVGHSLGSNIAIACADRFAAHVAGVVVISAALSVPLIEDHLANVLATADPALRAIVERYEAQGPVFVGKGPPDEYGVASSKIYQPHVLRGDADADVLWSMRQAIGPAAALWGEHSAFRVTGLLRNVDQRETVARVTCSLTAVAGADDAYAATSLPFFLRAPHGRVVRMPDSLHHAHVEEPPRVAEIVLGAVFPLPADAPAPLRLDVTVDDDVANDTLTLTDTVTNFSFALPGAARTVLAHLGQPRAEIVEALADAVGEDDVEAAVSALVEQLASLGLLQDGRGKADVDRAQKISRAHQRRDERFADVKAAVVHAFDNVPLHHQRLQQAGVSPDDLQSASDLQRIPPLTKADVRKNFPDGLVARGVDVKQLLADGSVTIGATSGTSDERLQVLFDWTKGGLPERARELWNLSADESLATGAVFTTPLCAGFECHLGATTPAQRTRGVTLTLNSSNDVFGLSDDEVRAIVGELSMHKPDVLFVHPWYAAWLLRRAQALGLSVHQPTVVLTSYQMLTRRHRGLLSEGFGAPVFSYWGATDLGGPLVGVQCHHGHLHVREDQVFVEVEPSSAPGAAGRGTLLVTLLSSPTPPVMPLVRYRLSDVVRLSDEPCTCALGGEWQTIELFGRARDALTDTAGNAVCTRDVDDALGDDGPDFWRLGQKTKDRYVLEHIGALSTAARARLQTLLGDAARVDVVAVKRFSPERSLKFRQTWSDVGSPFVTAG
jgi:phenylacetate-CoA ligase